LKNGNNSQAQLSDGNDCPDEFGFKKALRTLVELDYTDFELIGKGSYGLVTKAECKKTG